jgi:hypothetical protein
LLDSSEFGNFVITLISYVPLTIIKILSDGSDVYLLVNIILSLL